MCWACDILGIPRDREYLEISAGALSGSTVTTYGMVVKIPPAQVVFFPSGARMVEFYN